MNQLWFVSRGKEKLGPFSSAQLRAQARSGELQPQDLLLLEGKTKWVAAASVKGLFPTATETPRASASGGDSVSRQPASPLARQGAVAGKSSPPKGMAQKTSLLRSRTRLWVLGACCVPILVVPIIWGVMKWGRPHKSTLEQDPPTSFISSGSDLDDLARLLSQDVIVGTNEFHRPDDDVLIEAIKKLRSSSDKAVATACAAAKDAMNLRAEAIGLDLKVTEENRAALATPIIRSRFEAMGLLWDMATEDEISEFKRGKEMRGEMISPQDQEAIDAWYREREERPGMGTALAPVAGAMLQRRYANVRIGGIRQAADAMDSDVFAQHLVPALRARAGAKIDAAPFDLKVGRGTVVVGTSSSPPRSSGQAIRRAVENTVSNEEMGLASGSSRYDRELTRLSLLIEFRQGVRSRFVAAFIPRLRPSEPFRLVPIPLPRREPVGGATRPESSSPRGFDVRYSAWCDQFAIEDRELPPEGYEEVTLAYAVEEVTCNASYLCDQPDPGWHKTLTYAQEMARAAKNKTPQPKPENFCRYGLTFTELKPEGNVYKLQARLDQYDVNDKEKVVSSVTYAGVLRAGPEKKPQATRRFVSPEAAQQRHEAQVEENKKNKKKSEEENRQKLQELKEKLAAPRKTRQEREQQAQKMRQEREQKAQAAAQERKQQAEKAYEERRETAIQLKLEHADLVCELEAEGKKLRFAIRIQANGHLDWNPQEQPLKYRELVPAELMKERDRSIAQSKINNDRFLKARALAKEGKKAEAEKALKEFLASSPGELWEKRAREVLDNLDGYARRGEKMRKLDQSIADYREKKDRLIKAYALANEGKKEEAEKVLNELLASSPPKDLEDEARELLSKLDWYAEKAAREKAAKSTKARPR